MATAPSAPPKDWFGEGYGPGDALMQRFLGPDAQFGMSDLPGILLQLARFGINPVGATVGLAGRTAWDYFKNRDNDAAGGGGEWQPAEITESGFDIFDSPSSGAPPRFGTTDPNTTLQGMNWMATGNSAGNDPFGYGAAAASPGDDVQSRSAARFAGRPWYESVQAAASGGPSPMSSYGPPALSGGMSSYLFQPAGGGPPIPIIEGPKYTGAPYNPLAFADWVSHGDSSWWEQHNNAPWAGGGPVAPAPVPPLVAPRPRLPWQEFQEDDYIPYMPMGGGGGTTF